MKIFRIEFKKNKDTSFLSFKSSSMNVLKINSDCRIIFLILSQTYTYEVFSACRTVFYIIIKGFC